MAEGEVMAPPAAPVPRLALQVRIRLGEPVIIGRIADGVRRIVPILGGTFDGEELSGEILPFGGDWQIVRESGRIDLDARYTLRTDRNELLYVNNLGSRYVGVEAAARLMVGETIDQTGARSHGHMRIETAAERLRWMNDRLFIPRGRRGPDHLAIAFYDWT